MFKYNLIVFLFLVGSLFGQEFNWSNINSDNSQLPNQTIKTIAVDQNGGMWFGTYMGGIASLQNEKWTVYSTSNSGLPHNYVNTIAIDKNNVKWIGTDGGGLARFDGTNWEVYKTSNSGLPSNVVMNIYCDDDGSVWIGTYFGGLAHYDNGLWSIFNDENSPLLSNKVVCITKDKNGILWAGTQGGGAASFDGKNWNIYTERNSKLTNDYVYSIAVDNENKKWIGTGGGGLAVFNDVFWIKYNSTNSELTDDNIRPIVIDEKNNKWIGTYIGGINLFDGKKWLVYDFQNSSMPDDEITCMKYYNNNIYVGTERSGIIRLTDLNPVIPKEEKPAEEVKTPEVEPLVVNPVIPDKKPEVKTEAKKPKEKPKEKEIAKEEPVTPADTLKVQTEEKTKIEEVVPVVAPEENKPRPVVSSFEAQNHMVLMLDAADVYFDLKRLSDVKRAYRYLLKNREKVDANYDIKILVYSSNYDVSPKKISFDEKTLTSLYAKDVVYMEGENTFTEAVKKAFNLIKNNYNAAGNNQVFAATYKFIRDDETATVVIKDNLDNNTIIFNLLAFNTATWKLENKMRKMVPKGSGHYYSINKPGIKDNWSVTGQLGMSVFRGDVDKKKSWTIPGVYGIAVQKKLLSTGFLNGGIKAQFNFGKLKGEKNSQSFENNFFEASVNFQAIMNKWINRNFKFEKFRPYAFGGIGIINYRALLRDSDGNVVNGIGYDVIDGNLEGNGTEPEKNGRVTEIIFPVGLGVNYKIDPVWSLEFEVSSRYINSDKLDAKIRFKDDKYWFVTLGVTYKINTKSFVPDILNK
ncbi:MAG: hypothetical protein K9G76_09580 [Bacteroidales bacterium]|nr:hypothetical protein [Bacteroidales bacterium]MCF8403948.1 hypothetical protein [Bacteroidales bacterium]